MASTNMRCTRSQTRATVLVRQPATPRKCPSDQTIVDFAITTPSSGGTRTKKRVRFSDPGLAGNQTGITPMINKATLRQQAAASALATPPATPFEIRQIVLQTPLRQSLTPRTRRQLRRSHLSEEQNALIGEEKSARTELAILRKRISDLTDVNEAQCQNGIRVDDNANDRVVQLEAELAALRTRIQAQDDTAIHPDPSTTASPHREDNYDHDEVDYDDDDLSAGDAGTGGWEDEGFFSSPHAGHDAPDSPVSVSKIDFGVQKTFTDGCTQASLLDLAHIKRVVALERSLLELTHDKAALTEQIRAFRTGLAELGFGGDIEDEDLTSSLRSAVRKTRLELETLIPGETTSGLDNGADLLVALLARLRDVLASHEETQAVLSRHQQTEKALRGNFNTALARHRELEQKLEVSEQRRADADGRLQRLDATREEEADNFAQLEDRHDELKRTLEIINDHRDELIADIATLNAKIEVANDEDAQQKQLIASLEETKEEQSVSNTRLQDALNSYRADLTRSDGLITQLEAEMETLRAAKNVAEAKFDKSEEELINLREAGLGFSERQEEISELLRLACTPGLENVTVRPSKKRKLTVDLDEEDGQVFCDAEDGGPKKMAPPPAKKGTWTASLWGGGGSAA